ncbi:MAG: hypothetical protein COV44_07850 [Deltaproteobacteria bacterium CG11_big_fil_rev_8_21_14_0_20_45_16]|nr:MAG: hypothetical protein COV44_07850 [Deltaproteobacteria bacterium CG11_big_fil_rev_8_21_14_0_20_45_16]
MSAIENKELEDILNRDRGVLIVRQTLAREFLISIFKLIRALESHEESNQLVVKLDDEIKRAAFHWAKLPGVESFGLLIQGDQIFLSGVRVRPRPYLISKFKCILRFFRSRKILGFELADADQLSRLPEFVKTLSAHRKGESLERLTENLFKRQLTDFVLKSLGSDVDGDQDVDSSVELIYNKLIRLGLAVVRAQPLDQDLDARNLDQILYELNSSPESELISFFCTMSSKSCAVPLVEVAAQSVLTLFGWAKSLGLPPRITIELASTGFYYLLNFVQDSNDPGFRLSSEQRISRVLKNWEKYKEVFDLTELQLLSICEFSMSFGQKGVYEANGEKCYQHFFSRMLRVVLSFHQSIVQDRRSSHESPQRAIMKLLQDPMGCDRSFVKLFVSWVGVVPVGSFVELQNGDVGQVCSVQSDLSQPHRPVVAVLKAANGEILGSPKVVDLNEIQEKTGLFKSSIAKMIEEELYDLRPKNSSKLNSILSLGSL